MQPLHPLLLLAQNRPADNMPTPAAAATAVSRSEEAGRSPQPQPLHLLQQTGALLPGRFVREAAFGLLNHAGRASATPTGGGRSTERSVQGRLVGGGAAGGAPAGLLVVRGAGSSGGGGGRGVSVALVVSVVAFALRAAGAVDGADVMVVADITQRHVLVSGRAV